VGAQGVRWAGTRHHGRQRPSCANIIGCDAKTLRKHFRYELDRGAAEADAAVASYLFANAKGGNVTAQIFWLKRARWRERRAPEDPVPGAEAGSTSPVIILPDNGRDPEVTEERRKAQAKYFARKQRRQLP
jgi:hypothetical protein